MSGQHVKRIFCQDSHTSAALDANGKEPAIRHCAVVDVGFKLHFFAVRLMRSTKVIVRAMETKLEQETVQKLRD